jgi:hypothetical protein
VPFPGQDVAEVAQRKELGTFVPAREVNDKMPRSVDTILAKLMARMPGDRFQTAGELIDALTASGLTGESKPGIPTADTDVPPAITKPDISVAKKEPRPRTGPIWTYQYRHGSGWKRGRARTQDIIQWYEEGILPDDFFVARPGQKTCQHFRTIAEFQELKRRPLPIAPRRGKRLIRIALIIGLTVFITTFASILFHLVFGP